MHRTLKALVLLVGSIAFAGCLQLSTDSREGAIDSAACNGNKVEMCHVPPGNPDNAHTICIGAAAVDAHVGHGDHPGSCDEGDDPEPPACAAEGQACNTDSDCCLDAFGFQMFCAGFCYRAS